MMLNWFVSYCNYYGYYFYDQNNYSSAQQRYIPPVRRIATKKMANYNDNTKSGSGGGNNQIKNEPVATNNSRAIEEANLKKGLETKIEPGNKGYDLLLKMGYQEGQGLGKSGKGIMEPLGIVKKTDRKGLTATAEIAKNGQTGDGLSRSQRKRRGRRGRGQAERNAGKVAHEAHMARELATKAKKAAERAVEAANRAEQVASTVKTVIKEPNKVDEVAKRAEQVAANVKTENKDNNVKMEVEVEAKPRRKHSPIRAPTPEKKIPVKPETPKQKAVTSSSSAVTSKSSSSVKTSKASISINDPITPQFLQALAECFHSEIELMQIRLEAAASRNPLHIDDDLIVAKIIVGLNQTVAEHAFEYIRTDLVGWIGVYQKEGMATPIFHSMTNNSSHITVVCDNDYAFKCLLQCIDDITRMKTMGSIRVIRLPPITPLVYCFDAIYEGVARDAALFLEQIHLHKPKLYSDNWVVVSHEVCPEERKTYFIFLIDERSALALNFHYSSNLLICMQKVSFRNRGIVTEEYLK